MKLLLLSLASLSSLAHASTWNCGTAWGIGFQPSTSIVEATTTFSPGAPPSSQISELYLWPGMTNGTGDLLQTTVQQFPNQTWCGGTSNQWCLRTSVFGKAGQFDGAYAPLSGNQAVTINFKRSADKTSWTQTATVGGQVVSQLTSPSGPMTGWGVATECVYGCDGTISAQTYTNTTIVLETANPTFGATAKVGNAGAGTMVYGLQSLQGGKVWNVGKIVIPAGVMLAEG